MRGGARAVWPTPAMRLDALLLRMGVLRLCCAFVLGAVVLSLIFGNLLFLVLTGGIPPALSPITAMTASLTSLPLVFVIVTAFWRTDRSRAEIREQARLLDERNAALAAAEESLREANETLETRVEARTAELERARCEAEEANAAKSQFLANMSHELRTPLNAILGFSDMLIQRRTIFGAAAAERVDEYAADIHGSGSHLLSLVNDLLDLARIECGQIEFRPETLAIAPLIDGAVLALKPQATARGQTVDVTVHALSGFFEADARAMHQILVNLLSNALKFSEEGASVDIEVTGTARDTVFTVTDRGQGMTPDEVRVAVEPFSRLSEAHIASGDSIGLGLSIVHALATLHGGRLTFESERCRGTVARIDIPVRAGRSLRAA